MNIIPYISSHLSSILPASIREECLGDFWEMYDRLQSQHRSFFFRFVKVTGWSIGLLIASYRVKWQEKKESIANNRLQKPDRTNLPPRLLGKWSSSPMITVLLMLALGLSINHSMSLNPNSQAPWVFPKPSR